MAAYRVYFIDKGDHIFGAENFDAEDDTRAMSRAEDFCSQYAECVAVEIWEGKRCVHRHDRPA